MQYRSSSTILLTPRTCPSILLRRASIAVLSSVYPRVVIFQESLRGSIDVQRGEHAVGVMPRNIAEQFIVAGPEVKGHPARGAGRDSWSNPTGTRCRSLTEAGRFVNLCVVADRARPHAVGGGREDQKLVVQCPN